MKSKQKNSLKRIIQKKIETFKFKIKIKNKTQKNNCCQGCPCCRSNLRRRYTARAERLRCRWLQSYPPTRPRSPATLAEDWQQPTPLGAGAGGKCFSLGMLRVEWFFVAEALQKKRMPSLLYKRYRAQRYQWFFLKPGFYLHVG